MKKVILFNTLCLVISALPVPFLGEITRLFIACYGLGSWLCRIVQPKASYATRIVVSISAATAFMLLLALILKPNTSLYRAAFALICAVAFVFSFKRAKQYTWEFDKATALLIGLIVTPFIIIALANPYILLLSDGWWHISIYNMVKHFSLPPPTPWLAGAQLAYPFALHLFLVYVFGTTSISANTLFLFAAPVCAALSALVLAEAVSIITEKRVGFTAGITFILLSTIGSIAFLIDFLRFIPKGLTEYLAYLQVHQGPHMLYTSLKFINNFGVNTVFQSTAMLAFFPLVFFTATVAFLLRKEYALATITYLPLIAANPVYAMLAGGFIAIVLIYDKGFVGLQYAAGIGLAALIVNAVYLNSMLTKPAVVSSAGFLELLSNKAIWMLALAVIGYLPFVILTLIEYGRKKFDQRTKVIFLFFAALHIFIALTVYLAAVYVQTTIFLMLALFSAPYLSATRLTVRDFLRLTLIAVTLCSALLIPATYAYHTVTLDQKNIDAAIWLRDNTPVTSMVLEDVGPLDKRALDVYASTFGERRVYIADLQSLETYGEEYATQQAVYTGVFVTRDEVITCSLATRGVDYVFANSSFAAPGCLLPVYNNGVVSIYKT